MGGKGAGQGWAGPGQVLGRKSRMGQVMKMQGRQSRQAGLQYVYTCMCAKSYVLDPLRNPIKTLSSSYQTLHKPYSTLWQSQQTL